MTLAKLIRDLEKDLTYTTSLWKAAKPGSFRVHELYARMTVLTQIIDKLKQVK